MKAHCVGSVNHAAMFSQLFIATSVFVVTALAFTTDDCPSHFKRNKYLKVFGDKCYRFLVNNKKEFDDARAYCRYYDGELVMVKTREMNEFVQKTAKSLFHNHHYGKVWIGLRYSRFNRSYEWEDGSAVEDTNFGDKPYSLEDDCVYMQIHTGKWYTHDCNSELHSYAKHVFVCEYQIAGLTTKLPKVALLGCPSNLARDEHLKTHENKCYRFVVKESQFKNFENAQKICKSDGGNLAVVKTKKVNDFLKEHMDGTSYEEMWIGLRYHKQSNKYKWDDGTDFDNNFDHFDEGQKDEEGDCVAMDSSGSWFAQFCDDHHYYDNEHPYVCEYPHQGMTTTNGHPAYEITPTFHTTVQQVSTTASGPHSTAQVTGASADASTPAHVTNLPDQVTTAYSAKSSTCTSLICNKDCGLNGYKQDEITGCSLCVCDG